MPPRVLASGPKPCGGNYYHRNNLHNWNTTELRESPSSNLVNISSVTPEKTVHIEMLPMRKNKDMTSSKRRTRKKITFEHTSTV